MTTKLQLIMSLRLNYLLGITVYLQNTSQIQAWHLLGLILIGVGLIVYDATVLGNIINNIKKIKK